MRLLFVRGLTYGNHTIKCTNSYCWSSGSSDHVISYIPIQSIYQKDRRISQTERRPGSCGSKKKEQDDALMLLILKIELRYIIDKTNERGFYTIDERRRYQYMFDVYKERGGNGEIERDFLKLDSLPYEKQ